MSILRTYTVAECDHCGKRFQRELELTGKTEGWSVFDYSVDALRGNIGLSFHDSSSSVQADLHLCGQCTKIVDESIPESEDRNATPAEVLRALGKDEL